MKHLVLRLQEILMNKRGDIPRCDNLAQTKNYIYAHTKIATVFVFVQMLFSLSSTNRLHQKIVANKNNNYMWLWYLMVDICSNLTYLLLLFQ